MSRKSKKDRAITDSARTATPFGLLQHMGEGEVTAEDLVKAAARSEGWGKKSQTSRSAKSGWPLPRSWRLHQPPNDLLQKSITTELETGKLVLLDTKRSDYRRLSVKRFLDRVIKWHSRINATEPRLHYSP